MSQSPLKEPAPILEEKVWTIVSSTSWREVTAVTTKTKLKNSEARLELLAYEEGYGDTYYNSKSVVQPPGYCEHSSFSKRR